MKNKNLIIGIVALLVILLAGVGYMILGKSKAPAGSTAENANSQQNTISSIQDIISSGKNLTCDYSDESGRKFVAYISGGKVRSDIIGGTQEGSVIMRDGKIYYWTGTQGFVMNMPNLTVTPAEGDTANANAESMMEAMENYKNYCKEGSVSQNVFELPANVKFQDASSMMQQAAPSGAMPSGQSMPSGIPTNYQQMMEQYQQ